MELTASNVRKVLIIGSGTMGLRIGLMCALKGYGVVMYDLKDEILETAQRFQRKIAADQLGQGRITQEEHDGAFSRIHTTTNIQEACKEIDLVSENVTEEEDLKHKVFHEFGRFLPDKAVITTNTSYLLPSMFIHSVPHRERFCAYHFHDVFLANVVDIMPHTGTAPWVVQLLKDFGKSIKQIPVVIEKESSGYLFNAMLLAVLGAAGKLLTNKVASLEDIDRSWMGNFKQPVGPFGIMDSIGLDTAWHVTKNRPDRKSQRFAELLKKYVDQGKLGLKTGEGFYKYPNPAYQQPGFLMGR